MNCKRCQTPLKEGDKFCPKCGILNEDGMVTAPATKKQGFGVKKVVGIVAIVVAVLFVLMLVIGAIATKSGWQPSSDSGNTSETTEENKVAGVYTREVFSGNTFEFEAAYGRPMVLSFDRNGNFVVTDADGDEHRGKYEVYNGLNIATKCKQIMDDNTLGYGEELADDISSVANSMMDSMNHILNTYLLWLEADSGSLQPFVIQYAPEEDAGVAVNILAQTQGAFVRK